MKAWLYRDRKKSQDTQCSAGPTAYTPPDLSGIDTITRCHGAHMLALSSARAKFHVSEIVFSVECKTGRVAIRRPAKKVVSNLFSEGEGGYSALVFRVPEDVQLNARVVCDVKIAAEDDRLDLSAVKLSDI